MSRSPRRPGRTAPDIGAYELQAPPIVTAPSSPSAPPPPPANLAPRVRVSCPRSAKPGGCRFKLQALSAKPHGRHHKANRGRPKAPVAESAVAKVKLAPGKSALVTLTPKPKFAAKLEAAAKLLVREVVTLKGKTRTSYRRLAVVE